MGQEFWGSSAIWFWLRIFEVVGQKLRSPTWWLDWGWRIHFLDGSLTCLLPVILSSLSVFMTGQPTSLSEWSKRERQGASYSAFYDLYQELWRLSISLYLQSVWHSFLDPSIRHKILALETENVITCGTASTMIICIFVSLVLLPKSYRWAQLDTCTCPGSVTEE